MITAPQYGVWSPLPPATDNPAAVTRKPPTAAIREHLAALRAEFAKRASNPAGKDPVAFWRRQA